MSRCFGFIEFEAYKAAEQVNLIKSHIIDNKSISCKFQANKRQDKHKKKEKLDNVQSNDNVTEDSCFDQDLNSFSQPGSGLDNSTSNDIPFSFDIEPIEKVPEISQFLNDQSKLDLMQNSMVKKKDSAEDSFFNPKHKFDKKQSSKLDDCKKDLSKKQQNDRVDKHVKSEKGSPKNDSNDDSNIEPLGSYEVLDKTVDKLLRDKKERPVAIQKDETLEKKNATQNIQDVQKANTIQYDQRENYADYNQCNNYQNYYNYNNYQYNSTDNFQFDQTNNHKNYQYDQNKYNYYDGQNNYYQQYDYNCNNNYQQNPVPQYNTPNGYPAQYSNYYNYSESAPQNYDQYQQPYYSQNYNQIPQNNNQIPQNNNQIPQNNNQIPQNNHQNSNPNYYMNSQAPNQYSYQNNNSHVGDLNKK